MALKGDLHILHVNFKRENNEGDIIIYYKLEHSRQSIWQKVIFSMQMYVEMECCLRRGVFALNQQRCLNHQ